MQALSIGVLVTAAALTTSAHAQQVAYTSFGTATSLSNASNPYYPIRASDAADCRLGWRFVPTAGGGVTQIDAVIERIINSPVNLTMELYNDSSSTPDLLLGSFSATVTRNSQSSTIPQTSFFGDGSVQLLSGQTYYVVLSRASADAINWIGLSGLPSGVQVTRGSWNAFVPPSQWEISSVVTPNGLFPPPAFRITVPSPTAAACLGMAAIGLTMRRRRPR